MKIKYKINKLANDGEGLSYYKNKPLFTYYALPGENVEATVSLNKRNVYVANTPTILSKSRYRVNACCKYYTKCGGCSLLHLENQQILNYKRGKIKYLLNTKILNETKNTMLTKTNSYNELRYRNSLTLPIRTINNKNISGLFLRNTNKIFNMETCILQKANLDLLKNDILDILTKNKIYAYDPKTKKEGLRYINLRTNNIGEIQLALVVSKNNVIPNHIYKKIKKLKPNLVSIYEIINKNNNLDPLDGPENLILGNKYLLEYLDNIKIALTPKSFFQLNYDTALNLYKTILYEAKLNKKDKVLDAYSGVSSISFFISKYVSEIWSVEINKEAVKASKFALKLNKINNVKIIESDLLKISSYLIKQNFDKLIFDPPRTGLDDNTINFILKSGAKFLLYVSCNPETLVRDLNKLKNRYTIKKIIPFDMFPKTSHVESLTVLEIKK